jgi:hypothetical protein
MSDVDVPARPDSGGRARRIYVWWAVGFGLLLALGLFCWLLLGPYLQTRAVLKELRGAPRPTVLGCFAGEWDLETMQAAIRRLGGEQRALCSLRLYARLPRRLAPEQAAAVHLLGYCGEAAVPSLLEIARRPDVQMRLEALAGLERLRPDTHEAVAVLAAALQDPSDIVRGNAGWALREFGAHHSRHAREALPALVEALDDAVPEVRLGAAHALGKIEPATPAAIPGLLRGLKDRSRFYHGGIDASDAGSLRSAAAYALGRLGPQARAAVPGLIEALNDASPNVRESAAWALGEIGPEARQALPALESMLKGPDPLGGSSAAEALRKIRGEAPKK